jgi:hypothetical protein
MSMADTPYAQASPLPSWMLEPSLGGAERQQQQATPAAQVHGQAQAPAASQRPNIWTQHQEGAPAQPGSRAAPSAAAQPIGADALNQALGAAMGGSGRALAPAQEPPAQVQPARAPQLGNVAERVAGLSGSVPRWASGSLDAPAMSAAAAAGGIDAQLFSSAISAAMSSIGQAPQQQVQPWSRDLKFLPWLAYTAG